MGTQIGPNCIIMCQEGYIYNKVDSVCVKNESVNSRYSSGTYWGQTINIFIINILSSPTLSLIDFGF